MSTTKVLYPGSFDPITYGHMDVIEKALKNFDKVIIGVFVNNTKKGLFDINERKNIISEIYKDEPRIEVISCDKNIATVQIAMENDCYTIARGIRDLTDSAYEIHMAALNHKISDGKVDTIAYFSNPANVTTSSSVVKEIFNLGIDISSFVHPIVMKAMLDKRKEN